MDELGADLERADPPQDETHAARQRASAEPGQDDTKTGAHNPIVFFDHTGTRFLLPYRACRTWTVRTSRDRFSEALLTSISVFRNFDWAGVCQI